MASREVVEYIKQEMRAGHAPAQIKQALLDVGWSGSDVEAAMQEVGVPQGEPQQAEPHVTGGPQANSVGFARHAGSGASFQSPQPAAQAATPAGQANQTQSPSTLDRNLASRTATPGAQPVHGGATAPELVGGLSRLQSRTGSAPLNIPTEPGTPAHTAGASAVWTPIQNPATPGSRLNAQSTGATLDDFTGTTAQSTPVTAAVRTPSSWTQEPAKSSSSRKAGGGWYFFIGFLLGVLLTLLLLGGYVYLTV